MFSFRGTLQRYLSGLLEIVANSVSSRMGRIYAYCLAVLNILRAVSSTVVCSMQLKDTEAQNTTKCKNVKPLYHKNGKKMYFAHKLYRNYFKHCLK
jgi:hypothetical protein